jgi:hypothetical protein
MATRKPLVLIDGAMSELPSGDSISVTASPVNAITLDFGSTPIYSKQFTFSAPGAITSQNVVMVPSAKMPAGLDVDELEMDVLSCAAFVSAPDTITAIVTATPGPITGQRNFNYQVG